MNDKDKAKYEAYLMASHVLWMSCDGIEEDDRPHPWEIAAEWFDARIKEMEAE